MNGTEILDRIILEESRMRIFDPREPRISSIGLCNRRQVARALGRVADTIPWEYGEAGHVLENRVYERILRIYPDAVHEPAVETWIPGVYCHPDIYVPSERHCIQVKSGDASSASWGQLKPYHRDQVWGEWLAWMMTGPYAAGFDAIPLSYEVLYLDRSSFGRVRLSVPVRFDQRKAAHLIEKFWEVARSIEFEILPPRPKVRSWECYDCNLKGECWE